MAIVVVSLSRTVDQAAVEALAKQDAAVKDFVYVWRRWKNWGEHNPVVARRGKEFVGFHAVTFGKVYANSYYQYVAPSARGQGVGGKMVDLLLGQALKLKCARLKFRTPLEGDGYAFWSGFGLVPYAQHKEEYLFNVDLAGIGNVDDLVRRARKACARHTVPEAARKAYLRHGATLL